MANQRQSHIEAGPPEQFMNVVAIVGLCLLCGLTDLKAGDIQPVEIWSLICLIGSAFLLLKQRGKVRANEAVSKISSQYILMLALIFIGSLLSLRLKFYPPADFGILKTPPWASFVRFLQLFLAVSCLFIITFAIGEKKSRLRLALKLYTTAALANALWAIVSGLASRYEIDLSGAYTFGGVTRLRGSFVEGGPFGVYLAGAILMLCVRRFGIRDISLISFGFQITVLLLALAGAQSKAAILLLLILGVCYMYFRGSAGVLMLAPLLVAPLLLTTNVYDGVNGYIEAFVGFDRALRMRPDDATLIMGRIMAAVLLPRMVAEYPVAGIGIGNYSLMRNNPEILQGLPTTSQWDLPGLGLLGYVAELGIPLTLYVLWVYSAPIRMARNHNPWIGTLGAYPVLAALFGVQLNFAYPWIISGMALSAVALTPPIKAPSKRKTFIRFVNRKGTHPVPIKLA